MLNVPTLIDILGSKSELARLAEVSKQAVSQWGERVPAERCRSIEKNSGGRFTRYQLRPDVFGDSSDAADCAASQWPLVMHQLEELGFSTRELLEAFDAAGLNVSERDLNSYGHGAQPPQAIAAALIALRNQRKDAQLARLRG